MMEPNDIKEIELKDGTVKIIIPRQAIDIDVDVLTLPDIGALVPDPIGFHPFRLVVNLKMVQAENRDIEVHSFDPPIEIRVRYTQQDVEITTAVRRDLLLGYWDGFRWSPFTNTKHNFHLIPDNPPGTGGWGVVVISQWDDPTKAWGT